MKLLTLPAKAGRRHLVAQANKDKAPPPAKGKTPPLKGARPYFTRKKGS